MQFQSTPIQQPENILDQFGKVVTLRNLLQQGQLHQQQITAAEQENQMRAQSLKDQQAMTQAMQEWDGKDYNSLPGLMMKHGASAQAVMTTKTGIIKQQQDLASLNKDQLGNEKVKGDYIAQQIDNVKQLPPDQQPQAFEAAKADLVNRQFLDPKIAQGLQYQGPQQLDMLEKQFIGRAAAVEQAAKQADIYKNTQQGKAAESEVPVHQADAQIKQAEANMVAQGGMTQQMADNKYRMLQTQIASGQKPAPADQAFVKAYEKQKTLNTQVQFNLQNAGATGGNGQPSAIAKAIADGSMKWNDAVSPRTPMSVKQAMLAEVKQLNPSFNSGDFEVEKKVREKFTSGNVADQLLAIGTAREHMKTFSQLSDALDNGNVQLANRIGNAFGIQFGSDKATNFRIAAQAFGGEVGKAFDGAGVVAAERDKAEKSYNDAMSKGQFKGAIQTVDALLAGKQKAAKEAYENGRKGQPNFGDEQQSGNHPLDKFWH